ncbi:MAG: hypothetical protein IJ398_06225 [Clostridia bacterium]|nr:hypothetical protein [Clostridia bacterium]
MKKIIGLVLLVLLGVGLLTGIGACTNGFTSFDMREPNPDNLIKVEDYVETLTEKRDDDIEITVSEMGEIKVVGENETDSDIEIIVTEITLDEGEYTLSSSAKGVDDDTYYLCIKTGEGETLQVIYADSDDDSTFEVEADDTTYTVAIVICAGEEIEATFKPVLVEGDEVGKFYVIG